MQFIDLAAQQSRIRSNIDAAIKKVLDHGKYIMGPEVFDLEDRLADYVGVKHCISCANGTDALQLVLMARGIGPGDLVFVPSFTFFATAEVIALVGAQAVFVDIEEDTYNLCPQKLEAEISRYQDSDLGVAKAIIAVDLFGQPANYPEIERIAKSNNLYLIEDGAQGFGGELEGEMACSFGDIATTSFFPAKPLGCYGDGGAIFTNDDDLAVLIKSIRIHGQGVDKYDNVRIGLNSRLDTIQAAILVEKFKVFPEEVALRNEVASAYSKALSEQFIVPFVPGSYRSSWAQYTVRSKLRQRESVLNEMKNAGVPSAVYYPAGIHKSGAFQHQSYDSSQLAVTEKLQAEVFSLPMHPYLTNKDIEKIIASISE